MWLPVPSSFGIIFDGSCRQGEIVLDNVWMRSQSTHRVAMATLWRTFHHDRKIILDWWGWGVNALPLSLYLLSRTKLWCTLQLRGHIIIHSPYSISPLALYVICECNTPEGHLLSPVCYVVSRRLPPNFPFSALYSPSLVYKSLFECTCRWVVCWEDPTLTAST